MTTYDTHLSLAAGRRDVQTHDEEAQVHPLAGLAFALCICPTTTDEHDPTQQATPWVSSHEIAWRDHIYYPGDAGAHVIRRIVRVERDDPRPTADRYLAVLREHGQRDSGRIGYWFDDLHTIADHLADVTEEPVTIAALAFHEPEEQTVSTFTGVRGLVCLGDHAHQTRWPCPEVQAIRAAIAGSTR